MMNSGPKEYISHNNLIWKRLNWIIFYGQAAILVFGLFLGHISFGWGLGDLFWYALMIINVIIHLILSLAFHKKAKPWRMLAITFGIILILLILKATIWRGVEYPWNGKLFYLASI